MGASTFGPWRHLAERFSRFRRRERGAATSPRRAILRVESLEDRCLPSANPLGAAIPVPIDLVRISPVGDTAPVAPADKTVSGGCALNPEAMPEGDAGTELALDTTTPDEGANPD